MVQYAMKRIYSTKRGKWLIDKATNCEKSITITYRYHDVGEANPKTGDVFYDPATRKHYWLIGKNGKVIPNTWERSLAHELGHAVTGIGDDDVSGAPPCGGSRMSNIIANENPVAEELGQATRYSYNGLPRDPNTADRR
jgi:hypothetical protein